MAYGWHYIAKFGLENVREVTLTALVHHLTPQVQEALPKFEEKAPIVETIADLFESEVKKIMQYLREESLRNILSAVGEKRIISALGPHPAGVAGQGGDGEVHAYAGLVEAWKLVAGTFDQHRWHMAERRKVACRVVNKTTRYTKKD